MGKPHVDLVQLNVPWIGDSHIFARGSEKHRALLQHAILQAEGMRKDCALRFVERDRPELHLPRRRATTWLRMDSAISGAVIAPISSPTGAAMRPT